MVQFVRQYVRTQKILCFKHDTNEASSEMAEEQLKMISVASFVKLTDLQ